MLFCFLRLIEHYFEMSKIDAQEALSIYRHFCKETERVVEYLGVAKKLQNLLNVPIPNLRHVCIFTCFRLLHVSDLTWIGTSIFSRISRGVP
jgi:hypothetical protein